MKKGMKIAVCGRIQTGSYNGKDDRKVYTTEVVVDEHYFAESKATEADDVQETKTDSEGFMEVPEGEELPFE